MIANQNIYAPTMSNCGRDQVSSGLRRRQVRLNRDTILAASAFARKCLGLSFCLLIIEHDPRTRGSEHLHNRRANTP